MCGVERDRFCFHSCWLPAWDPAKATMAAEVNWTQTGSFSGNKLAGMSSSLSRTYLLLICGAPISTWIWGTLEQKHMHTCHWIANIKDRALEGGWILLYPVALQEDQPWNQRIILSTNRVASHIFFFPRRCLLSHCCFCPGKPGEIFFNWASIQSRWTTPHGRTVGYSAQRAELLKWWFLFLLLPA